MRVMISLLLSFVVAVTQAQVRVYFDRFDREISSLDSACYYSLAKQNLDGLYQDTVKYFFADDNTFRGFEVYDSGVLNGRFTFFHKNGSVFKTGSAKNGRPFGIVNIWYESGPPHQALDFFEVENNEIKLPEFDFLIMEHYDSSGKRLVTRGDGIFDGSFGHTYVRDPQVSELTIRVTQLPKRVNVSSRGIRYNHTCTGKVVMGYRDSTWSGVYGDTIRYWEEYESGQLITGKSMCKDKVFQYSEVEEKARPQGGYESFYRQVAENLSYPVKARRKGIEGRVYVQFVVGRTGNLESLRVIKGIGGGCDEEAIRVLRKTSPWHPGRIRGIIVRQRFALPLNFKLG